MRKRGWKFFSKNAGMEVFEGTSRSEREVRGCVFLTAFPLKKRGTQLTLKLSPVECLKLYRCLLQTLKSGADKYQTYIIHRTEEHGSSSVSMKFGKVGLLVRLSRKNGKEESVVVPISKDDALFLAELLKTLSTHVAWVERVEKESGSKESKTQTKKETPSSEPPPDDDIDF